MMDDIIFKHFCVACNKPFWNHQRELATPLCEVCLPENLHLFGIRGARPPVRSLQVEAQKTYEKLKGEAVEAPVRIEYAITRLYELCPRLLEVPDIKRAIMRVLSMYAKNRGIPLIDVTSALADGYCRDRAIRVTVENYKILGSLVTSRAVKECEKHAREYHKTYEGKMLSKYIRDRLPDVEDQSNVEVDTKPDNPYDDPELMEMYCG